MEQYKPVEVTIRIWGKSEEDAQYLKNSIQEFINTNGKEGRYIDARRTADILNRWQDNIFIKNHIINYYK